MIKLRCFCSGVLWFSIRVAAIIYLSTNVYAQTLSFAVEDTRQDKCFNDSAQITSPVAGQYFYGQDAQYTGNTAKYAISGDGLTVTDATTGLTWQRSPALTGAVPKTSDKLDWANTQKRADTLNAKKFAGYSDWRLPTIKELYSLIDGRGTDPSGIPTKPLKPFIDTSYFKFSYGDTTTGERIIDAQYASSTTYHGSLTPGEGAKIFGVNFADGRIKGYGAFKGTTPKTFFVICVRGNSKYGVNKFFDTGNGTVIDSATGLMWQKADDGKTREWKNALYYADTSSLAGYTDWRLPDMKELQSIVDYTRTPDSTNSASIDPLFTCTQIKNENNAIDYPWYWASTTHIDNSGRGMDASYVAFGRGLGYMNNTWVDVHGAGCQRSDPKTGVLSDNFSFAVNGYYNSRAPQGDAIRIYNYTRLVRTAFTQTSTEIHESGKNGGADGYFLQNNYPNPFNPTTTISYLIPANELVTLRVYDVLGKEVAVLVHREQAAGNHSVQFTASNLPGGVYFYSLQAGSFKQTKKLILLK